MKFSILMANYNAAKFIKEAIKSVFNQTFKDWELIIVDDKSSDNSRDVIETFSKNIKVKFIERSKNGGYGKTLQTAIQHASGELCAIVDSDDVLHRQALEIMVEAHDANPDCGLIYSQFMKCDENLIPIKKGDCGPLIPGKTWLNHLIDKIRPKVRVSHLKTFRRSDYDKTKGFHELRRTVDKDIVLKLEEVTKLLFIDKVLYSYRIHSAGISRSQSSKPFGRLVMERALKRRGQL